VIPALLAVIAEAWAGPCAETIDGFPVGPVAASLTDGALGTPRRTCLRSELGVGAGGRITADTANFYGLVIGGLVVDGSAVVHPEVEVFGRLEALRLDLGIASFQTMALGLGHTTLGAAWARDVDDELAVGVHGQLVLPTATGLYEHGRPFGAELALTSTWTPHRIVRVHDQVSGTFVAAANGPALPAGGLVVNLGVEVRPVRAFGVVVDLDGGFLQTSPVDRVALGAGLRFGDGRRFGFELGARVPFAGRDRTTVSLLLRGSVRFGRSSARSWPPPDTTLRS
jgi:hypothetical protein